MATTTFEKESVNAVGGQLFIATIVLGSNVPTTGQNSPIEKCNWVY